MIVPSSMHLLMDPITETVYLLMSWWWLLDATSLKMLQSVHLKQSCRASNNSLWPFLTCFVSGFALVSIGLYAGVSITVMWSESPRWGQGVALYEDLVFV